MTVDVGPRPPTRNGSPARDACITKTGSHPRANDRNRHSRLPVIGTASLTDMLGGLNFSGHPLIGASEIRA